MEATAIVRLSPFDTLAGKLMFEARPLRGKTGRLALEEYEKIADQLDNAGFKPQEQLEGKFRKQLAPDSVSRDARVTKLSECRPFDGSQR
jgi:hypothetical protein